MVRGDRVFSAFSRTILAIRRRARRRRRRFRLAVKPRCRACSAMRGCGAKAGNCRNRFRSAGSSSAQRLSRPSLDVNVSACARLRAALRSSLLPPPSAPRGDSRRRGRRARPARAAPPPVARARLRRGRSRSRLPSTACELRQREQAFAVECRRRDAHVRDAGRDERCGRARTRCEGRERGRPASGAGTPYSAALADTKIATS